MQDSIGIVDLIDCRRSFGTQSPAASWMQRVAFELADFAGGLIDIREQPARRLTIEAGRRHERIVFFDTLSRPAVRFDLGPIVPMLRRRGAGEQSIAARFRQGALVNQPQRDGGPFDPT